MRAMVFTAPGTPLVLQERPIPQPGIGQVLIQVSACAVCRTDLHIIDGELPFPQFPRILGHQIVGTIVETDARVTEYKKGDRVGVPWLGGSCGICEFCRAGKENLCDEALFTGYACDGGFAEYCVANAPFIFPIPPGYPDQQAAPLLCAGVIGFRSLRFTKGAKRIGFFGFGASAHLLTQVVKYQGNEVYAFTKQGDLEGQSSAKKLGAVWAGSSDEPPPILLDAAIIFAPVGPLIPKALEAVKKGGIVISAGIHMSDIPAFAYKILWGERTLCSVGNLTRRDGKEFLALAPKIPVRTQSCPYPLEKANEALDDLRHGRFSGSAVLIVDPTCQ